MNSYKTKITEQESPNHTFSSTHLAFYAHNRVYKFQSPSCTPKEVEKLCTPAYGIDFHQTQAKDHTNPKL